jgi:IS30 family transposase
VVPGQAESPPPAGHVQVGAHDQFRDPKRSVQRGSNEEPNGMLSQLVPTGVDVATINQDDLDEAIHPLNRKPQQSSDWVTPSEESAETRQ